jgi:hypothetical protein
MTNGTRSLPRDRTIPFGSRLKARPGARIIADLRGNAFGDSRSRSAESRATRSREARVKLIPRYRRCSAITIDAETIPQIAETPASLDPASTSRVLSPLPLPLTPNG